MAAEQRVAIVIPCYQYARFLGGAIESALSQSVPAADVIVVDDGSTDRPDIVAERYPSVRLISQSNRGLAAARNAGLREVTGEKVIFLDADDRLYPNAIGAGLLCFRDHPDAAFVYGRYREVRRVRSAIRFREAQARADFVRCNSVGMVATAMFDREKLASVGGFDESLGMCEDWDVYLRLTREHSFAAHREVVARYVRHRGSMSNDTGQLLRWVENVRERERERGLTPDEEVAWMEGRQFFAHAHAPPLKRFLRRLAGSANRRAGRGRRR